jgi:nitrogenase molybdenum-iron protein alpha/beta subunit
MPISAPTRAADERFWKAQEARRQQLGQPACSQSNMSWALYDMPGDLAVVIHGESDCLNCFFHHVGTGGDRFYSTRLTDHHITTGTTAEPLAALLRAILRRRKPEAIVVLGTCPVEVIGDRFEETVSQVAADTDIPIVALHTHGLALMPLHRIQDWMYATLAELAPPSPEARAGINLLGVPEGMDRTELATLVDALGLTVNGSYPGGTTLADWRRMPLATTTYTINQSMYRKVGRSLKKLGQAIVDVPMPLGIQGTRAFFSTIAEKEGVEDRVEPALAPFVAALQADVDAFRARAAGRRIALCIRMLKTHRVELLAHGGLAPYALLQELGFTVEVLIQGPTEDHAMARYTELLEKHGLAGVPITPFPGPWKLGEVLTAGGFHGAIMSDVARRVVEEAGIPWVATGRLRPGFAGMTENLERLGRLLP